MRWTCLAVLVSLLAASPVSAQSGGRSADAVRQANRHVDGNHCMGGK